MSRISFNQQSGADTRAREAPSRGTALELDYLINVGMDNYPGPAHEFVVRTVNELQDHALTRIQPGTLAQMMAELGRHVDESRGVRLPPEPGVIEAGYKLVQAARVPPSFFEKLRIMEEQVHERMTGYHMFDRMDLRKPLDPPQIQKFTERFMRDFAQCHGMQDIPAVQLCDTPGDGSGACWYDPKQGRSVVEINIHDIQHFSDLPKLMLVAAHEARHAYGSALRQGRVDDSVLDDTWQAQFTVLNIFNRDFYTSKRADVYFNHAEEHLAEITGVGFAVRAMARMGFDPQLSDFGESRAYLSGEVIGALIDAGRPDMPAPSAQPRAVPSPSTRPSLTKPSLQ